jgi:hypothetical protein
VRFASGIEQNIPWLDVSMNDAVLVSIMNRPRQLRDYFGSLARRHLFAFSDLIESTSFDQSHAKITAALSLPDFVDWDHEGVVQFGSSFCLKTKPFEMPFGPSIADSDDL